MTNNSVQTILNFDNRNEDNLSDWSMVWSTTHVPGMDTATGGGSSRRRKTGRRRLRIASLSFCSMLVMHPHVNSVALIGGFFIFMLFMIPSVALLGNPLRHFEVYLGQWSISGPGRAFRIIPMLDGIGIAICVHAFIRAILSSVMAGITLIYMMHSASDDVLPFTYCRHMNLTAYEPETRYVDEIKLDGGPSVSLEETFDEQQIKRNRNEPGNKVHQVVNTLNTTRRTARRTTKICTETYNGYPPIYRTPAYNFFYVEVIHYREDNNFFEFNKTLIICVFAIWLVIWLLMVIEKFSYGRVIWNNMYPWFSAVPWLWSALLLFIGLKTFLSRNKIFRNKFQLGGNRDILSGLTDALVISAHIHAAGLGSEIVHGKGLNYYASGHIDPNLNGENIWHSGMLFFLTAFSAAGTEVCALNDYMQTRGVNKVSESSLWIFPMYSKCTSLITKYSHTMTTLIFSGLTFAYTTIAFICTKTALHTIFEYRVTLVFVEQLIVGASVVGCALLSIPFATNGGLGLLEALDAMMMGVAMPLVCVMETLGLIYIYRSRDFISDMNIATEENACSSRLGIEWQIMPPLCLFLLIAKIALIFNKGEIPISFLWYASSALFILVLSVPVRAICNGCHFMKRRH